MYRIVTRCLRNVQNCSGSFQERRLLSATVKCEKAAWPGSRVVNGGEARAFSTSPVKACEKKDNVTNAPQGENTDVVEKVNPTETPSQSEKEAENHTEAIKMDEQIKEPAVLQTDGGNSTKKIDVTPGQEKTVEVKSDKVHLLELLRAMKVNVTNKRSQKVLQMKETISVPKANTPSVSSTIRKFQRATVEASSQSDSLDPKLVKAASAAASTLPNPSQAKSELLQQLRQHKGITEVQKKKNVDNLCAIISEMDVKKSSSLEDAVLPDSAYFSKADSRSSRYADMAKKLTYAPRQGSIFKGKRLNIFSTVAAEDKDEAALVRPTLWDLEFAKELSAAVYQMPRNGFEEMIQWTKEGLMWQYPIDNEAGLEEEAAVPFHEHIFLEKHLEDGFPTQGPVRHFMELVVAGLSKNPNLTVQQKKEHISWFRDYFHQKESVLQQKK
ncbi:small ribosomal subunit protein mS31 isoform 1-T1 [Aulostomus maculatus]